jgi:hypothetical protein
MDEQVPSLGELLKDQPNNWGRWGPEDEVGALQRLRCQNHGGGHEQSREEFYKDFKEPGILTSIMADSAHTSVDICYSNNQWGGI